MSLQGTLDTFALPDVLRLLASTAKTGHLRLDGDRGTGELWLDTGHVVGADAERVPGDVAPAQVIFELLRFGEGSFEFDADMTTSSAGAPLDVEPLLEEAQALLDEWREIEAVVPSLDVGVQLAEELPKSSVTVNARQWRFVAAIGSGSTVRALGERFEQGELDISRSVKELVESGLAVIGEAPAEAPVAAAAPAGRRRPQKAAAAEVDVEPLAAELGALAALADQVDGPDAPELARQLAQLGPEAARAVAAAAEATTDEEREAALATLHGDDGEPINRGLLLKFLSTVRS